MRLNIDDDFTLEKAGINENDKIHLQDARAILKKGKPAQVDQKESTSFQSSSTPVVINNVLSYPEQTHMDHILLKVIFYHD